MSKIQKIDSCVDCNDYVECSIAVRHEIPLNCPLPDKDAWKSELLEWIESQLDDIPKIMLRKELVYSVELLSRKKTLDDLKQKIKEL
jgi:hypothetical protein